MKDEKQQSNVKENNNSKSTLITRERINKTPFTVIGNEETGYFIAMGDYRLTEIHKRIEQAMAEILEEPWNVTLKMMSAIIDRYKKEL